VGVLYGAGAIDDKARRNRQLPFRIAIRVIEINTEFAVDFFEVIGKTVNQIQLPRILIIFVVENVEIQTMFGNQLGIMRLDLWGNRNQSR